MVCSKNRGAKLKDRPPAPQWPHLEQLEQENSDWTIITRINRYPLVLTDLNK